MSESRIAVKIVAGRFVTVYPPRQLSEHEEKALSWRQAVHTPSHHRHNNGWDASEAGILGYAMTRADHAE
jgi:hypothetical protein